MMITIILIAFAIMVLMARKGGRNMSRYVSGAIDFLLSAPTLAGQTLLSGMLTQTVVDSMRVSSIKCVYTLSNVTPQANTGPMLFGVAHSDYDDTEIEGWVESAGSWDLGNKTAQEVRSRLIRQIGVFDTDISSTNVVRVNDGKPIKTKLNWNLAEGQSLRYWVYNTGATAYATTAPSFKANGTANLWIV